MGTPKINFQNIIFLAVFISGNVSAFQNPVEIKNYISACVDLTPIEQSFVGSMPLIKMDVSVKAHVSQCGCMSSAGLYSVYVGDPYKTPKMVEGIIATKQLKSGQFQLPLALTADVIQNKKLTIVFSCLPPA